jgi:hypothetical protein
MKRILAILIVMVAAAVAGCHAQVPPATSHVVNLSWTAPAANGTWSGCTAAAPCAYAVFRCSAGATTCGDTTASAWKEITTGTTRAAGTTYTDPTAGGLTAFYVVETVQGGANSGASNITTVTVPGTPLAPTLSQPTSAQDLMPQVRPALPNPDPQLAMAAPMKLTARVVGSR